MATTPEERRLKKNARSLAYKKKRYAEDPEWRARHNAKSRECLEIRKLTIPGYKEKINAYNRECQKTPAGKLSKKKSDAKYSKTAAGKLANAKATAKYGKTTKGKSIFINYAKSPIGKLNKKKSKDKRKRSLGSELINDWFPNCNRHHVNKNQIICIPSDLHKSFSHKQNKPETMILINRAAFQYLTDTIKQI